MLQPAAMRHFLDVEKPIAELEGKIEELRRMSEGDGINIAEEIARLTDKADKQLRATYAKLTAWQKTQVARHPQRPKAGDYLRATGQAGAEPLFLDEVPIRFGMADDSHYHVPLLLSPFGFSTYRGS
jgi:5-hydroxyisourate hydrolase-like protein (transthyretin family)